MVKKRRNIAFSLSFLDIMACGFGAVTLLFLILRHNATEVELPDPRLASEVDLLQQDIRQAEEERVELLNSLEELQLQLVKAQGDSERVITDLEEQERSIQADPKDELAKLRRQWNSWRGRPPSWKRSSLATRCGSFSAMATASTSPD